MVCHNFHKKAGSYTLMSLLEHFFQEDEMDYYTDYYGLVGGEEQEEEEEALERDIWGLNMTGDGLVAAAGASEAGGVRARRRRAGGSRRGKRSSSDANAGGGGKIIRTNFMICTKDRKEDGVTQVDICTYNIYIYVSIFTYLCV